MGRLRGREDEELRLPLELTERDLKTFMPIAGLIFVILLALYFRNIAGTILPLITVCISIVWTLGTIHLLGFSMSILSSLIPNLVLILGIADGVHILTRHQEDLRTEPDRRAPPVRQQALVQVHHLDSLVLH